MVKSRQGRRGRGVLRLRDVMNDADVNGRKASDHTRAESLLEDSRCLGGDDESPSLEIHWLKKTSLCRTRFITSRKLQKPTDACCRYALTALLGTTFIIPYKLARRNNPGRQNNGSESLPQSSSDKTDSTLSISLSTRLVTVS